MNYTESDKVKIFDGRIAAITKVFYEMVDSKETDNVYCYEATIGDKEKQVIYPEDIKEYDTEEE